MVWQSMACMEWGIFSLSLARERVEVRVVFPQEE
jgi:hypothetical protein